MSEAPEKQLCASGGWVDVLLFLMPYKVRICDTYNLAAACMSMSLPPKLLCNLCSHTGYPAIGFRLFFTSQKAQRN